MDKTSRRRECFARVKSLTAADKRDFSLLITKCLSRLPAFQQAQTVFSFSALDGEPDLRKLAIDHPQKRWAFPRVTDADQLTFHAVPSPQQLIAGRHGIAEPDPRLHEIVPFASADLIIVPGVSFDPINKARLGRGKGHYDRYLAETLARTDTETHPILIGVCFSAQLSTLTSEDHDVPMDHLLSELGWGH